MTGTLGSLPLGLVDVQRSLFHAVTADPLEGPGDGPPVSTLVAENGLSAPSRVAIYRDGYRARLVECLVDDYPAVQALLGEATFRSLCHDYIQDVPPGISLNHYGARFADYCTQFAPRHALLVAELAQLEWALVKAVHGSDVRKLTPEQLAELSLGDWDTAALVPSPTLTLLATAYPVNAYLQAFRDGLAPEPPSPLPSWVAVCRSGVDVWRIDLPAPLGRLFARSVSGEPLARTFASLEVNTSGGGPEAAAVEIQAAFSQWMRAGCFSGVVHAGAG